MKRIIPGLRIAMVALVAAMALPLSASGETIASGLQGASGSTIGPDGALYVTEGAIGRISRIDRKTGQVTTCAEGLPPSLIGIGGAVDLVFVKKNAYVLVTLVGFPFGGDVDGIYRIDGPNSHTVVADLGAFSAANPPDTSFELPQGLFYAMEDYFGGFLVTDGHHNRVLFATKNGDVREFAQFDNIVPTGLDTKGLTVFMAQAGALPHAPEDGKIVAFWPRSPVVVDLAAGAPLLVDVELGRGFSMFGLAQGEFGGGDPGAPAKAGSGSLVKANKCGGFDVIEEELNLPTSLEIVGDTAYIVTLTGDVLKFRNISGRKNGKHWWKNKHSCRWY
ncbi:MAG: hypothetical protein RLN69_07770 [Woeseiaceae bacterium]